jgi:DNA-binding SARP family transcriptional activator
VLLPFVRLSSERVRQAVRQDCSFAKKQASPPALLVVVRSGRLASVGADGRFAAQRSGRTREALAHFEAAEALYVGEFLEEDAYEDWASAVREDAIASYASVLRALGEAALARGDHDAVVRYRRRSSNATPGTKAPIWI